jgi:hypothetical protein
MSALATYRYVNSRHDIGKPMSPAKLNVPFYVAQHYATEATCGHQHRTEARAIHCGANRWKDLNGVAILEILPGTDLTDEL